MTVEVAATPTVERVQQQQQQHDSVSLQVMFACALLPLLLEPVLQGVLPGAELQQLTEMLGQLASMGQEAVGASGDTPLGADVGAPVRQDQQQQQQGGERLRSGITACSTAAAAGDQEMAEAPSFTVPAAVVAFAPGVNMSLAALLNQLQCSLQFSGISGIGYLQQVAKLLQQAATHFPCITLNDVPADMVVVNHFLTVEDAARQVLDSVEDASSLLPQVLAVQLDVEGSLQLAAQPAVSLLFTQQELQSLVGGLVACRHKLAVHVRQVANASCTCVTLQD